MYQPQGEANPAFHRLHMFPSQLIFFCILLSISGGMEMNAVVAEIGGYAARLGFAGEDYPRSYFPSCAGFIPPDDSTTRATNPSSSKQNNSKQIQRKEYKFDLGHNDSRMNVHSPLSGGLVEDWDMVEQIWQHANKTALTVDLAQTPLLLIERAFNTSKLRQEYAELMFEKFQSPALFLAKDSVLSCFACGKTSGLVVDIGAETTTVGPVQDGWLEAKGLMRSHLGGRMVDRYLRAFLERDGVTIDPFLGQPPVAGTGEGMSASYRDFATLEVVRGLKESVCRMPEASVTPKDPKDSSVPKANYELPDGTVVSAGWERFQAADILMNPEPAWELMPEGREEEDSMQVDGEEGGKEGEGGWSRESLPRMAATAVRRCEKEQQSPLLSSVVLAGGGACLEGTMERLKVELENAMYGPGQAGSTRVKVLQAGPQERKICAWLGGSIVGSLGTFHEMWVSKAEYGERGARVVDTKCP